MRPISSAVSTKTIAPALSCAWFGLLAPGIHTWLLHGVGSGLHRRVPERMTEERPTQELTRQRSSLATLKHPNLCESCSRAQRRDSITVTCQRCGTERRYPPSVVRRLTSGLCRRCWASSLPRAAPAAPRVDVVCPVCGSERLYRKKRVATLKTPLCQKCYLSRQGRRYRAASHG